MNVFLNLLSHKDFRKAKTKLKICFDKWQINKFNIILTKIEKNDDMKNNIVVYIIILYFTF